MFVWYYGHVRAEVRIHSDGSSTCERALHSFLSNPVRSGWGRWLTKVSVSHGTKWFWLTQCPLLIFSDFRGMWGFSTAELEDLRAQQIIPSSRAQRRRTLGRWKKRILCFGTDLGQSWTMYHQNVSATVSLALSCIVTPLSCDRRTVVMSSSSCCHVVVVLLPCRRRPVVMSSSSCCHVVVVLLSCRRRPVVAPLSFHCRRHFSYTIVYSFRM